MGFKEFMLKRVADDVAPDEAHRMYQVGVVLLFIRPELVR